MKQTNKWFLITLILAVASAYAGSKSRKADLQEAVSKELDDRGYEEYRY